MLKGWGNIPKSHQLQRAEPGFKGQTLALTLPNVLPHIWGFLGTSETPGLAVTGTCLGPLSAGVPSEEKTAGL